MSDMLYSSRRSIFLSSLRCGKNKKKARFVGTVWTQSHRKDRRSERTDQSCHATSSPARLQQQSHPGRIAKLERRDLYSGKHYLQHLQTDYTLSSLQTVQLASEDFHHGLCMTHQARGVLNVTGELKSTNELFCDVALIFLVARQKLVK